ncbi:ATP-binding protein [Pseudophaeobacter sp.]|uniref:ATP-binding protein n=1 Tax=Pseudophaeobacter sp. TaxID=1971739 RepID=UPI0032978E5C
MNAAGGRSGIRQKVNRSLILPIVSLVFLAALVVAVSSYRLGNTRLEKRVETLAHSSAVLFEDLLWQLDYDTIQLLLDEHITLGAVTGAQLTARGQILFVAGTMESGSSYYSYTWPLMRSFRGEETQLGMLTLQMSRQGVLWDVGRRVLATLAVAALAVLATVLIIQRLLNRRLILPVLRIADGLENWRGDWRAFEIDLGRRCDGDVVDEGDELDRLVHSIHSMRNQILSSHEIIKSHEQSLLVAAKFAGIGFSAYELETGRYLECDKNFANLFGMTEQELACCSFTDDIIPTIIDVADAEKARGIAARLAANGTADGVFLFGHPSGDQRYIRQFFMLDTGGRSRGAIVRTIAQDVTEMTQLQANYLQAQKLKSLGSLTGGLAHDFNNILAIILGNLELLQEEISDEAQHRYLDTSLMAVRRGTGLTSQLLAYARKQPLRPEIINASQLLDESRALLNTTVGETIDLEFVLDGGLWAIEADKTQLETAILNLVINARDAMPDGGKLTLEVSNARLDRDYTNSYEEVEPGQYVCIAVSDMGTGMDSEAIDRALEPFYTTKGVGKGTGLGLPMAYGFTKQSGGHFKIYSEVGSGTTVKIYLPRVVLAGESPAATEGTAAGIDLAGLHVFLIEDDDSLRRTFETQLRKLGCLVHVASDGPAALHLAKTLSQVDLILCDVILPNGMNGPSVVAALLETFAEAAVVYMSGYTENAIVHQGRLEEGVTMLQKPFAMPDLKVAFHKALGT